MKSAAVDVAILGAGISGLTLGYELKGVCTVALLEKSLRTGGWIHTVKNNGQFFELGPNSIRTRGSGRQAYLLAKKLGLEGEMIFPSQESKKRYVLHHGQLEPLPDSFDSLFTSPLLKGILSSLLKEPFIKRSRLDDESINAFFSRRFTPKITETLIDAMITGIYAGDGNTLSMRSCFPTLFSAEKNYRSLLLWILLKKREKSLHPFFSFRNGMETLTLALQEEVNESLHLGEEVQSIEHGNHWKIHTASGKIFYARTLVSSLPLPALKKLMKPSDIHIPYASLAVVQLIGENPKQGFGYLVPSLEKSPLLGVIFNGSIFKEHRSLQMTAMLGGSKNPDILEKSDDDIKKITISEISKHMGHRFDPDDAFVHRVHEAIPQYPVGTWKDLQSFSEAHLPNMAFTGSAFAGVAVGDLVKHAQDLAKKISSNNRPLA